jgi:hypothetical protein
MAAKAVLAEEFIVFVNDNVVYHSPPICQQSTLRFERLCRERRTMPLLERPQIR